MSKPKVYLVGTSPGDVELITLKGRRLISQADVVLYDHLIPAEMLKGFGVLVDMQTKLESSAGLLGEFEKVGTKGKKVLLVKPEAGSPVLFEKLTAAGAEVEIVVVYKNIDIEPEETDFDYIDQILFTSASTVRVFCKHCASIPPGLKVYCLGQPTLDEATKQNIKAELLPT